MVAVLLSACSSEEESKPKEEEKSIVEKEIKKQEIEVEPIEDDIVEEPVKEEESDEEESSVVEPSKEEETQPVDVPLKTTITVDEFNAKFKLDEEEEQYPNGKFQLKDGTIVNADSYNYGESDLFDYAMAIFFEGKLAHLQLETKERVGYISKGLGVDLSNARLETNKIGYEIIFNETFSDQNIAIFPNEWD